MTTNSVQSFAALAAMSGLMLGCGGSGAAGGDGSTTTPPQDLSAQAALLSCDDSLKTAFAPDATTKVLLVKRFNAGDPVTLAPPGSDMALPAIPDGGGFPGGGFGGLPGAGGGGTLTATNEICLVKLLVAPGNPGPAGAPSTTAGIGIEVWLPSPAHWNSRLHLLGGAGWAGGAQTSLTSFADAPMASPVTVSSVEGAVAATTDTGHVAANGSFLMNSDGTSNALGWEQFSESGIHAMTVLSKALAEAYLGSAPKYTYWHGGSTGGRQGLKQAQAYPQDYDGIIAGQPAINWNRFTIAQLYSQIVIQRDLAGAQLTNDQLNAVSLAAINACDLVGGQHLGYLLEAEKCQYDPTGDPSVLCTANGGTNATASCVTPAQATAINKIWYGQTSDGTVPSPAVDNGQSPTLAAKQKWYGETRGTDLTALASSPAGTGTDYLALVLGSSAFGSPSFINATGNGMNGWKTLTYDAFSAASDKGETLQAAFGNIDTDDADLSMFKAHGGKIITVYGTADTLIYHQGFMNYYNRVATAMGGISNVNSFFKLYLVPGMGHMPGNGTANPTANPPLPDQTVLYDALTDWVEKGIVPADIVISSPVTSTFPTAKTRPICVYPRKATYTSGDINVAASYACE